MPNAWISHLKAYWAKNKSKGISYGQAMKQARASYKPKAKTAKAAAPKKRRRKKKAQA